MSRLPGLDGLPSLAGGMPAITPPAAAAPQFRAFGDAARTRQLIFDNVLKAAQGIEPVANARHTLRLADVKYTGPESYNKVQRKHALLTRGTLSRKLQGRWQLLDNATGQTLAERRTTLANVPYLTDDGTFVQRGNEYTMAHQMRLRPGVFARQQANGELEAHVNVLPGKGRGHRLRLDPETGIFKIQIGQANMPLVPLLRAMGVSERELREAWGNDLTSVNMQKSDPQVIRKLYERLVARREPGASPESMGTAVADIFRRMELDPDVTRRTLGQPYQFVDKDTILATTKKLLALNRREAEPDDRDHLAYQKLYGPEDLIAERLTKDRGTLRQLLWKSAARGLDHVPAGVFDKAINAALMSSGLASPIEQINPGEIFDQQTRVTRMGEGGITSLDAVPEESRSVQPSHLAFIDFLRTPESGKAGVDMRLARGARKGEDGQMYSPVFDLKRNQVVYKSPQDLADAVVAFPGELQSGEPVVKALVRGKMEYINRGQVDYEPPQMEDTFSPLANLIPMKSMVKGQRAVMAARMTTQALPLVDGEAPLVQSGLPGQDDRSFEEEYAPHMGAVRADEDAQVLSVSPGEITLRTKSGATRTVELDQHRPYNRKTFFHQTPAVQAGQTVRAGELLARSNYTDPNGVAALGKNLRVAYIPFRGLNFEDAIVISDSAARRLSSEHMYQHDTEWDDKTKRGKQAFVGIFPSAYPRKILENFDDDGFIKPGSRVSYGDPLVLVARERERSYGQVHRGRGPSFSDESIVWKHHTPGIVTDVAATDKGVSVVVKSAAQMEVGDKLSGRFGDKGVVADIIPDDEMPTDRDGKPFEILLNPLGLPSRVNPAQIVETALGKVAAATGKPYKIKDFDSQQDLVEFALAELRKHGFDEMDEVLDQETGRKIPQVFTGNRFFMKLHHTSESKGQGRALGSYTADGTPAKGGEDGAKRVGMLELGALLSHGAGQVIRDVKMVRGQANPQYWSQVMAGYNPPTPQVPFVYQKFVNQLRGAGINPVREGTRTHIMAMTDRNVDELAEERELQNVDTVDWKGGLKPLAGGLFDEKLTGGHGGNKWSRITLAEPMLNPVMEEPTRRLLGLTEAKFRDVIAGKEKLDGHTGPQAIARSLSILNVPKEIERARLEIASGKKTARDAAIRRLGYLKSSARLGVHPRDWVLQKVPVLPPAFRPVTTMGPKKLPMVADANYLYKELFEANQNLKELRDQVDDVGDEQLALYDAFKAVTGLGDPLQPKNQERNVKGLLKQIFNNSPKMGTVQRRLLSSTTDLVGRAVITPNPDLNMDEVGLPEERAWEVYQPFVVRNLVRRGTPRMQAVRMVKEHHPAARQQLVEEMGRRPVIINRAPTLHRYGMMAAYPRLVKGHTLQISPLVVGGYNADFDGDAMQYHVPSTDEAAQEALEKMLPSRNLFSTSRFRTHYHPTQEYVGGLYASTARIDKHNKPRVFQTAADAVRAYRRGEIGVDRQIEILQP